MEIGTNATLSIDIGTDPFFLGFVLIQLFSLPSSLVFILICTSVWNLVLHSHSQLFSDFHLKILICQYSKKDRRHDGLPDVQNNLNFFFHFLFTNSRQTGHGRRLKFLIRRKYFTVVRCKFYIYLEITASEMHVAQTVTDWLKCFCI